MRRLVTGGPLNSPWGMALAPGNFGAFSNDLLVGNFGDGSINAFDPATGTYHGQMLDGSGNPLINPGLWGLKFGNG
ncbi:MAG: TIGR03118 family protein, partial [Pseudomonadota bacterium]